MTEELFRILQLQSAWPALSTIHIRWNQMRNKQNWLSVITFVSPRSNQKLLAYTVLNVTNRPNINVDIRKHSGTNNSLESVFLSGKKETMTDNDISFVQLRENYMLCLLFCLTSSQRSQMRYDLGPPCSSEKVPAAALVSQIISSSLGPVAQDKCQ